MTDVKRLLDEATPLPWEAHSPYEPDGDYCWISSRKGGHVTGADASLRVIADHHLIVYAVNRLPDYEAAVDALDEFVRWWDGEDIDLKDAHEAREVLARLREGVPAE
jgi:hypothetical protein